MAPNRVIGFTCVENQILSLLSEHGQPIDCLFYDCAIPLCDLYDYTVVGNVLFYEFNMIERIQDVLKMLGIIEMKLVKTSVLDAVSLIDNSLDRYFLMRVKCEFVNSRIHKRSLREDHFVRVERKGELYKITNDIPNISLSITEEELKDAYDGQIFTIRYVRDISKEDIDYLYKSRRFKVEDMANKSSFVYRDINNERIVDLVVIYKTLRQRMGEYYKAYYDVGFLDEYIDVIERLRLQSQYSVLRKDKTGIEEIFKSLGEIEFKIRGDFCGQFEKSGITDNK